MILVPFKHTKHPVLISCKPFSVVAENIRLHGRLAFKRALCSVGFNIGLVNHIKAVFVAKVKEDRIRRIVRGSDGVDVELLHKLHVHQKIFGAHDIAGFCVGIVMVDAFEFDRLSVEQEAFAVDCNSFKADVRPYHLNGLVLIFKRDEKLIKLRLFCVPLFYTEI